MEGRIVSDRVIEKECPHLMAGRPGVPSTTIYRVLRRQGLTRLSDLDRTSGVPIRYATGLLGRIGAPSANAPTLIGSPKGVFSWNPIVVSPLS